MARVLALVASAPTSGGPVRTHFSFAERTSADRHLARKLEGFKTRTSSVCEAEKSRARNLKLERPIARSNFSLLGSSRIIQVLAL